MYDKNSKNAKRGNKIMLLKVSYTVLTLKEIKFHLNLNFDNLKLHINPKVTTKITR